MSYLTFWPWSSFLTVPGILDTETGGPGNVCYTGRWISQKYAGSLQSMFFITTFFQIRQLTFFFSLPLPCARNPSWRKTRDRGLSSPPERHIASLKWIGGFAMRSSYGPCPCTILSRTSVRNIFKTQGLDIMLRSILLTTFKGVIATSHEVGKISN